jgi:ankyrin repeat protein
MALLVELGLSLAGRLDVAAMLLQTYTRDPAGKHQCLEILAEQGMELPGTPPLAVHRGRIDLLSKHLSADPSLLGRTFSHEEIYPPRLGCHADHTLALHGAPVAGGTLLHLAVDGDEREVIEWLLDQGADPDGRAALDAEGFGGHTAIFGCVVSQPYRVGRRESALTTARLLLDRGADPNVRVSLRKRLRFVADEALHVYHAVTPLGLGRRFHDQDWVDQRVLTLLEERGGIG